MRPLQCVASLVLFLLLGCGPVTQPPSDAEAQRIVAEVQARFHELIVAANSLDADRFLEFLSRDGFSAMLDGQATLSFEAFAEAYRDQLPAIAEIVALEFTTVEVEVIDHTTALLINEYTETVRLTSGETVDVIGGGAQLWVLRDGVWRLQHIGGGVRR